MKTLALAFGMAIATAIGMAQAVTREHDMQQYQMAMSLTAQTNHTGYGVLKSASEKAREIQHFHDANHQQIN